MQYLLTQYLVQNRACPLPGIGVLTIEHNSAWYDVANKLMHPPMEHIVFNEFGILNTNRLIDHISVARVTDKQSAESLLTAFCNTSLQRLDNYQPMEFKGLGSLQKDEDGKITFISDASLSFLEPVHAERVVHKDKPHVVLVGDKETTSHVMTEYYKEAVVKERKPWLLWAAVLMVIAIIGVIYHFTDHSLTPNGIGNAASFTIQSPPETHSP
jgi:hypothetical protein